MQINVGTIKVDSVLVGRILAATVIVIALANSIYWGVEARSDGFWIFLTSFVTPLGVGFLILVVTEVVRTLQKGQDGPGESPGAEE